MVYNFGNGVVFYLANNKLFGFKVPQGLSSDTVWAVTDDDKGNLWFATEQYISKYDGKYFTWYTEREGLPLNAIKSLLKDRLGNLWFGTYGGG
jgi:ligand-binding sensor domain-containing protein